VRKKIWGLRQHRVWLASRLLLVSTVRLPVDHGWGGEPRWYETMIFEIDPASREVNYRDLYCDRFRTAKEAKAGHAAVLRAIAAGNLTLVD
jgi:hypothetical protein